MPLALPQSRLTLTNVVLLVLALVAGAVVQALFWHTGIGANWLVCDAIQIGLAIVLFRRGPIRAAAWAAMGCSIVLGLAVVRYASTWTIVLALPLNAALLGALPVLLRDPRTLGELARVPVDMALSIVRVPRALTRAVAVPAEALDFGGGKGRALVVGLALGLPTAGLFTLLLSSDPNFTVLLARAREKMGDVLGFTAYALFTAGALLFWHALHTPEKDAESKTLTLAAAAKPVPYRWEPPADALTGVGVRATTASAKRLTIAPLTWAAVVGQVALVFAAFDAVNARQLFGGHDLVRDTQGVTYASYLHAGFGQLLFATMLSVCLVMGGHRLLGGVRVGKGVVALEAALLVLTGVTLASCWQRLAIYEEAYGATYLRLGVAFVEVLVLGVLALTLGKCIARHWRGHAGALVAFTALLGVVAACFDADGYVASHNLDRAMRGRPLDTEYLASLSADACSALAHPYLAANRELGESLGESWRTSRPPQGWRAARGVGDRCDR